MQKQKEIPVCFATDDNYVPFLAVAVASLIDNASKENFYRIFVLITQLKEDNIAKIKKLIIFFMYITFYKIVKPNSWISNFTYSKTIIFT